VGDVNHNFDEAFDVSRITSQEEVSQSSLPVRFLADDGTMEGSLDSTFDAGEYSDLSDSESSPMSPREGDAVAVDASESSRDAAPVSDTSPPRADDLLLRHVQTVRSMNSPTTVRIDERARKLTVGGAVVDPRPRGVNRRRAASSLAVDANPTPLKVPRPNRRNKRCKKCGCARCPGPLAGLQNHNNDAARRPLDSLDLCTQQHRDMWEALPLQYRNMRADRRSTSRFRSTCHLQCVRCETKCWDKEVFCMSITK